MTALQAYAGVVASLLGRKLTEVAAEVAAGQPLPKWRTRPTPTRTEQPNSGADTPQPDA